ncbi:MAG TPA: hypothetical protein VJ577_06280 [Burkholderiaceae bacterium]|nr:hypothetical protein [Burkholderiaceae bacterium]
MHTGISIGAWFARVWPGLLPSSNPSKERAGLVGLPHGLRRELA